MPRPFKYRYIEFRLINTTAVTLRLNVSGITEVHALNVWMSLRKKISSKKYSTCMISTNEEKPDVKRGENQ